MSAYLMCVPHNIQEYEDTAKALMVKGHRIKSVNVVII